jgi:RNA polymerase sigma factor (sigma-70 family)
MAAARAAPKQHEILRLRPAIESAITQRVDDPDIAQDFVQETLMRLFDAAPRLEARTLRSYALVTAHNIVVSYERRGGVEARNAFRVVDAAEPLDPEESFLASEEREALRAAVERVPKEERDLLIARELDNASPGDLASRTGTSPGGVRTRLARARGRLRVEYLLAYRRVQPRTRHCRHVLYALSAGDVRRQRAIDASNHLLECEQCAALAEPLLRRRRSLAAILPLGALWRWIKANPTASAGAAVVAVAVVASVLVQAPRGGDTSSTKAQHYAGGLSSEGERVPWEAAALATHAGRRIRATAIAVESVPADEGFWIGPGGSKRFWVSLTTSGESRRDIDPGETVSFRGRVVTHGRAFAARADLSKEEGRGLLSRQRHHIVVPARRLRAE